TAPSMDSPRPPAWEHLFLADSRPLPAAATSRHRFLPPFLPARTCDSGCGTPLPGVPRYAPHRGRFCMNRSARKNDRHFRAASDGASATAGPRAQPSHRSGAARTGVSGRPGGRGPRPVSPGEFALPISVTPALPAVAAFTDLDLPAPILAALGTEGVLTPFPIQAATLPNSLAGRDVLGRGRTGSGKTLAFGLALLARTAGQRAEARQPLALILVPTRELAQQVTDALTPYARSVRLRLATVVGGMSIGKQAGALRGGAEIVVATPGRLKDLIDRGDCRL